MEGYRNEKESLDLLEKYKKMLDDKIITKEEFNKKKEEILNQIDESKVIVSEKWLWALATVPMLVSLILGRYWFMLMPYSIAQHTYILSIIVIVCNIIFLSLDISEMKKSGKDVEAWMWTGLLLVPVYLYVREKNTNKNYAPLIVWCVLCVLSLL